MDVAIHVIALDWTVCSVNVTSALHKLEIDLVFMKMFVLCLPCGTPGGSQLHSLYLFSFLHCTSRLLALSGFV